VFGRSGSVVMRPILGVAAVWQPVRMPSRSLTEIEAAMRASWGELLAEVRYADGSRQGVHYWNRLPGGAELDLTREQFHPDERVHAPKVIERPPDLTRGRLWPQYRALSAAVRAALKCAPAA
jgi:hypothetical protein